MNAKILTIDGPSGVGKGSVAKLIATQKNWALLDSGAIYRAMALSALNHKVDLANEIGLIELAEKLDFRFEAKTGQELLSVYLDGVEVSAQLRTQECAEYASQVAKIGKVRDALLKIQQDFATDNGLVADGRDMGTLVFPDAKTKVFLTASVKERTKRRVLQLQKDEKVSKIDALLTDSEFEAKFLAQFSKQLSEVETQIKARDERDMNRTHSPLKPATDALIIDTSELSIEAVVAKIMVAMSA